MEDEQREIIDHKENVVQENHPFEILCKVETTASAPSATSLHTTKNTPYKAHSSSSSCSTSSYSNLSSVACNMNQTTSVSPTSACSSTSTSSSLSTSFISSSQSLSQYEREKRELTLQLKIKEEKLKSLMNRNEYLEETNKRLQTMNENKENDLIKLKKEISTLMTEKDNLSNEIRKLSRSQNTSSDSSTSSLSSSSSSSSSLWGQMTAASRELCRAEEQINSLNHEIVDLKTTQCALQRQLEKYQEKELVSEHYTKDLEEEKEKRVIAESQLILAQHDNEELLNRIKELEKSLVENEAQYEEAITSLNDEIRRLEEMPKEGIALITSESFSDNYHHDGDTKSSVVEYQSIEIEKYLTTIEELKDKLFESEKARRKLHNKLQDLKGNVRVYVRCRPFLPSDNDENGEISCVNCNADGTTITLTEHAQRGIGQVYQFDQVYNSAKTQYDIFKDVSDFVQSALDGYRVCVFSYGQTGSGKVRRLVDDYFPSSLTDSYHDWIW